jgi:hypothetical protein
MIKDLILFYGASRNKGGLSLNCTTNDVAIAKNVFLKQLKVQPIIIEFLKHLNSLYPALRVCTISRRYL